ncbi:BMP family ABC transporter substrate-binding protein [Actinomycetaceae bacterium MB13-C1-2]|nr:BMP family ABC transporter substrate-binding protein [Actinomycetaceae bacterium MB13-C1-2]
MKNSLRFGAIAAAVALSLAACGQAPTESKDTQSEAASGDGGEATVEKSDVKACMVSDQGGFDDKSFNQSGHDGLTKAEKELGVEIAQAESTGDQDFAPNIENMVQGDCDIIIGVGFLMDQAMAEAAAKYPDVKFALVDSTIGDSSLENTRALLFNTAEAGYLAGYASAAMSTTGKVGTYLGMQIPSTAVFADGYSDGVAKYNEDKGTNVELLGWDKAAQTGMAVGNFEDQAKGKQFTEELFNQGADVVMPVAGPVGLGTLAAAKEHEGTMVVWVDADGYLTEPDSGSVILTSVLKQIEAAVFDSIKMVVDDSWTSDPFIGTLANDGVGIAPWHDFADKVPADLDDEISALRDGIIDGSIVVESVNTPK